MIRNRVYKQILSTIKDNNRFESEDFSIETDNNTYRGTSLVLKYIIDTKYTISFVIPNQEMRMENTKKDIYYEFSGKVCPGPIAYEESFSFSNENEIYTRIKKWLNCIWEELTDNPTIRQIESQQQQINSIFEKFENIEDGFFSELEANELKKRLDELEETLAEQLSCKEKEKKEFETEMQNLHNDIEVLKVTIQSFNKKGWMKSFTTKVFKWSSKTENQKMLKGGYKFVKEFLPEEIKNSMPDIEN